LVRAPVSRSRLRDLRWFGLRRSGGLPVRDHARVGSLGLVGELAFGVAHPLAGGKDAGPLALQGPGAGGDLEPPELLAVSDGCWWAWSSPRLSRHQNSVASSRGTATIALPWPRRPRIRF
jgi:hypothetical protein